MKSPGSAERGLRESMGASKRANYGKCVSTSLSSPQWVVVMIAEWLMERHGWQDVWYLGSNRPERYRRWWNFVNPTACYVGIWTGPALDLLCIRRCDTAEEAEEVLSPPGWTITHAAIRAWLKVRSNESKKFASSHGTHHREFHS
jgi:hypothetical protein